MKVVQISSSDNFYVYGSGFSRNADKNGKMINAQYSDWTNTGVLIKAGMGYTYDARIADWESVKALAKAGKIQIGVVSNGTCDEESVKASDATEVAKKAKEEEKVLEEKRTRKARKLEELADKQVELEMLNLEKAMGNAD